MRDALSNVLAAPDDDHTSDRILAAAFFRKRPLQAGASAHVIPLAGRKPACPQLPPTFFARGDHR